MLCSQCGQPIEKTSNFCGQCGAKLTMPSQDSVYANTMNKEDILEAITEALMQYSQLSIIRGANTDIEISNTLTDASWIVGKKKVEYSACILADGATRSIVFWEMIKESGWGLGTIFSFKKETFRSDGKTISGTVKECGYGFNGKVIDYKWDYSQVRNLVEGIVKDKGWQFKTVLLKSKATY